MAQGRCDGRGNWGSGMKRHSIYLGNVWEPPTGGDNAASRHGTLPPQAVVQAAAVQQVWRRRFSRPSGIEPGDRVLFVYERPAAGLVELRLVLNEVLLPAIGLEAPRWEHDITPLLRDRNELELMPLGSAPPESSRRDAHGRAALPQEWGRVSLDIVSD